MQITDLEIQQARQWASSAFTEATPPFSFVYDGQPSGDLLPGWRCEQASRALDDHRDEVTLTWTDPASGLSVRCVAVIYRNFPAVEWTVYFRNTGTTDTPILQEIQGMDTQFTRAADGEFLLHHYTGDYCSAEGYAPHTVRLTPGMQQRFAPEGGRA
ncbi:MAG TPA: hypothetical protein VGM23_18445, partial [Armatimonadota bacterium]